MLPKGSTTAAVMNPSPCVTGSCSFRALAAQADLAQGKVTRVLPAYAQPGAALYVVSPPLRLVPSRVTLLRDHLVQELGARLARPFRAA
jgi:DNA-binding transcriptional LysR family regulator